jgi:hypothetical protein
MITEQEINEVRDMALKAGTAGMNSAQYAVERCKLCIEVGKKLRAWKGILKHGEFGAMYQRIGLTRPTASKWMRASQAVDDGKISTEDVNGIRHLYLMLGIVPKKTQTQGEINKPVQVGHITLIARLLDALRELPVADYTGLQRRTLADLLKPIVDFQRRL